MKVSDEERGEWMVKMEGETEPKQSNIKSMEPLITELRLLKGLYRARGSRTTKLASPKRTVS
jgi:hypothetical protein